MVKLMHLRIVTPQEVLLDQDVRSVSFMGIDGSYGILPGHAPLMTATQPGEVKITHEDGRVEELVVTDGFAEVHDNVLTLVCEAGTAAGKIDLERARAAEERAREKLSERGSLSSEELLRAEAALRRALVRQRIGRRASGSGTIH
ncbi:MAG: ATP synthase F1 subunit epsilon [Planctomycetota bacterium]|jgi:F-type H+-transporting ATPase subunit epsilon